MIALLPAHTDNTCTYFQTNNNQSLILFTPKKNQIQSNTIESFEDLIQGVQGLFS